MEKQKYFISQRVNVKTIVREENQCWQSVNEIRNGVVKGILENGLIRVDKDENSTSIGWAFNGGYFSLTGYLITPVNE